MRRRSLLQIAAATVPATSAGCLAMLGSSETSGSGEASEPDESPELDGWPMVGGGPALQNSRKSFEANATEAPTRRLWEKKDSAFTPASDGESLYFARSYDSVLTRIDPTDGTETWNTDLNIGGAEFPPAIHDGTAFVPGFGGVVAVETDSGEVAWSTDEVLSASAPPTVADGSLYVVSGAEPDSPAGVVSLSTDDGSVEWTAPGDFRGPAAVDDGTLVVRAEEHGGAAIDAESGDVLWESSEHLFDTPLSVADGYAVGVTDRDGASDTIGRALVRLDLETGETRWTRDVDARYPPGVAIAGDEVFVHDTDRITGYELDDATVTTEIRYPGAAGPLVVADDGFLLGTWDGEAARVDRDGTQRWVMTVRRVRREDMVQHAVYSLLHDGSRPVVTSYGGDVYVPEAPATE